MNSLANLNFAQADSSGLSRNLPLRFPRFFQSCLFAMTLQCSFGILLPACDYTVRDIGFVNFDDHAYTLRCTGPEKRVDEWQSQASGLIELKRWHIRSITRANTSSESGYRIELVDRFGSAYLIDQGTELPKAASSVELLQTLLSTSTSMKLQNQAATSFAQIVYFHAADEQRSSNADEQRSSNADNRSPALTAATDSVPSADPPPGIDVALEAAAATKKLESLLPRPIALPVQLVEVAAKDRELESLLMWAAGLADLPVNEAALIVVYGRGRLAGPPLTGNAIQLDAALRQLALVGESCECDSSRDWTLLPRLPMMWDEEQSLQTTALLGFDPDSDATIAEVQEVLARGRRGDAVVGPDRLDRIVGDYFEGSIEGSTPTLLSIPPGHGKDAQRKSETSSTVIQGDGWGFDDTSQDNAEEPDTADGRFDDSSPVDTSPVDTSALASRARQEPSVGSTVDPLPQSTSEFDKASTSRSGEAPYAKESYAKRIVWLLIILCGSLLLWIPFRKVRARV